MADLIQAASPLPAAAAEFDGVTIAPARQGRRYSLRGRDTAVLSSAIGRTLPPRIGDACEGILQLGPDEYYAMVPAEAEFPTDGGVAASVVDVSSRAVGITVEGPRAAEMIMSGCPLDLDRLAVGRGTRTVFETVEIVVLRESETRFHIEVWRSFAPWLWQALLEAAHG